MKLFYSTILLCLAAVQLRAAELRLAIVPVDPRVATQAELLTAEFSRAEHGVAVLERAEVERIRREQNLTARSSADFARLGQAVGAQGVLVLDVFEQNGVTNLVVKLLAVQPGAVLGIQSYRMPVRSLPDWAALVGKQFHELLPKLGVLAQDAVPVSILNLRAPLKTGEGVRLENEATTLLMHRLIAQREIFVLERQHLALLGNEKELKDVQESPFWNGAYLLEGVIERGGATRESISVNARLVAPGRPSLTVSGKSDTGDLNALVDQLARDLIARLGKSTNSAPWNPAAEAKRYLQEAKWGMRWGNVPLAQAAADAAWTLGERSLETALLRVNSYVQASSPPRHTGSRDGFNFPPGQAFAAALPHVITALENFATLTPALGTNAASSREWQQAGLGALQTASGQLWNFWHVTNEAAQASETLARLRSEARAVERIFLGDTVPLDARTDATGPGAELWKLRLAYGWVFADSMTDTLAEFRQLLPGLSREQLRQFREHSHPWLMPWAADERARAASAWSAFLDEQSLSTNAAVALTARLIGIRDLSLRNTPADADMFLRRQQAALTYVKHRQMLLCQEPELVDATLQRLNRLVRQGGGSVNFSYGMRTNGLHTVITEGGCFDDALLSKCFYAVAFDTNHLNFLVGKISEGVGTNSPAPSRRQFLRAFLGNLDNQYRWYLIEKLFRAEDHTDPAEARKTMNALNEFAAHFRRMGADDKVLAVALNPAAALQTMLTSVEKPATPPPAVVSTATATNAGSPDARVAGRWWVPAFTQSETQRLVGHGVLQALARDAHVWVQVRGVYQFLRPAANSGEFYWHPQAFEQFFRVTPEGKTVGISPVSWLPGASVTPDAPPQIKPPAPCDVVDGILYVQAEGRLLAWGPRDAQWRRVELELPTSLPMPMQALGGRLYFGSGDTLLEFNPANLATRVMASRRRNPPLVPQDRLPGYGKPRFLEGGTNKVYAVFANAVHPWDVARGQWEESFPAGGSFSSSPATVQNNSVVRWKVPSALTLTYPAVAPEGANVWGLDWPRRTLALFDPAWEEPLVWPMQMQPAEIPNPTPGFAQPFMLTASRAGVAIVPQLAQGVWIIARADLDRWPQAGARTPRAPVASGVRPVSINTRSNSAPAFADEAPANAAALIRQHTGQDGGSLDLAGLVSVIRREPALAEYRSLFKNFETTMLLIEPYDTNGNQRIDLPELDAMIKAGKPKLTREEFMRRWDANQNDKFDPGEVRAASAEKTGRRRVPR